MKASELGTINAMIVTHKIAEKAVNNISKKKMRLI